MHVADDSEHLVARLRKLVDLSPYQPINGGPAWLCDLATAAASDGGTLALLGPNGIGVATEDNRRVRAMPDPPGVLLAGLAGRVRRRRERVAVGLPPAARHLPLLLASSAVLSDTLALAAGTAPGFRRGVLVISPDLDMRSRYCDLYVGNVPLDLAKPGTRMKPNGELVLLRPDKAKAGDGGVCFFLPLLALPERVAYAPALIILDLRYAQWVRRVAALAQWTREVGKEAGVLALYTVGDSETLTALTNAGFADLPLDHEAIATCTTGMRRAATPVTGTLDWPLAPTPSYLAREHEVKELPHGESLDEAFKGIAALLDEYREVDNLDVRRARWLLATLTQMPVPLDWYERAARDSGRSTLRRLIERLGILDRDGSVPGAVIGTLRMAFERVYRALEGANPRAEMLRAVLPEVAEAKPDERVLLLVRDRTMERAVRAWLMLDAFAGCDWLTSVDIVACADYARVAERRYATAIVNGALPRRYRWILGGALAAHVIYLAYPYEVDGIERQLQSVYGEEAREARARRRHTTVTGGENAAGGSGQGAEATVPELILRRPARRAPETRGRQDRPKRTLHGFEGLAQALEELSRSAMPPSSAEDLAAWEHDPGEDDPPGDDDVDLDDVAVAERVECLRADVESRLHGKGLVWLPVAGLIEVVRPETGDDIRLLRADELRAGDVIVCLDADGRSGLFERMVELAADQPEMRYLATLRRRWLDAMQGLVARFQQNERVNYAALLRALQANGATITSELTVRMWILGQAIGPEDRSSIVAVGKVVGSEALVQHARELDKAFRRIRGIRQGIGRRLSGVIRRTFQHVAAGVDEQAAAQLEDRLSLPLNELLETIDLARVVEVSGETRLVPPQWMRRWRPAS